MDFLKIFEKCAWYKPEWSQPTRNEETSTLLNQCATLGTAQFSGVLGEVVARVFPIPFPITTVKLEYLKEKRPEKRLRDNIANTYPLLHERVLILMTNFLQYKRQFGSTIEKDLYKDMTLWQFIERLLKKRAISFVGARDAYLLFSKEEGIEHWETIGTSQEKPPLVLKYCLSYDEVKLSALLFVSGPTECINNGARHNKGVVDDDIEQHAIIIGAIGPRLRRQNRMEWEDILITAQQNTALNGYGEEENISCLDAIKQTYNNTQAKKAWRRMWADFYQVPSMTYEEVSPSVNKDYENTDKHTDRFVWIPVKNLIFDNEVYFKRIQLIAESVLVEAESRAVHFEKDAFVNVVGCGLGAWRASDHQADVYTLCFLETIYRLLKRAMLQHVSDVNFAYINVTAPVSELFTTTKGDVKKMFIENEHHPRGGITASLWNREPSSRLMGKHAGKLLVLTYPWDGNAQPGNEFWMGKLNGSGDSAAASSTQISELHNAHINIRVGPGNARLATENGLQTLQEYCTANV